MSKHSPHDNHKGNNAVDTALLSELKNGSTAAFDELFKAWRKPVHTLVYRITRSEQDAEDITQEVFIDLWNQRERINPEKNIRTYLFLISKRTALRMRYRSGLMNTYQAQMPDDFDYDNDASELVVAEEIRILTEYAIENMPKRQKEVFSLHYYEQLSTADIAQRLGISPENVRKNIQIAKDHLREIVALALFFLVV